MQDAAETISLYQDATRANYDDPVRQGALLEFPPIGELYYSGDLHGNQIVFDKLIRRAALRKHRRRHIIFQEIVHGGPRTVDGGCLSYQLLERLAKLKVRYPNQVHMLLGNHELSEYLGTPIAKGTAMESLNEAFDMGLAEAYGDDKSLVVDAIHRFIESMPIMARTPSKVLMCHSVPPAEVAPRAIPVLAKSNIAFEMVKDSFVYQLVWGRDLSDENVDAILGQMDCNVMIVGHTKSHEGMTQAGPKLLIIDSQHDRGHYVKLPLEPTELTMDDVLERVEPVLSQDEMLTWE